MKKISLLILPFMAICCSAVFAQGPPEPRLDGSAAVPAEIRPDARPETPPPGFGAPRAEGGPSEFGRRGPEQRVPAGPNDAAPAPRVVGESVETPSPLTAFFALSSLKGPRYLMPGDEAEYTFTVTNHLQDEMKNVFVFWPRAANLGPQLPDESDVLSVVSGSDGFDKNELNNGNLVWQLGELKVNGSKTYTVKCKAERLGEVEITAVLMKLLGEPPLTQASLKVSVVEEIPEEEEAPLVVDLMIPTNGETEVFSVPEVIVVEDAVPIAIPAPIPAPPTVVAVPVTDTIPVIAQPKLEEGAVSISSLKKITPIERRIQAMIAFAGFQSEYIDTKSAEKTYEAAIAELENVEQLSVKMRLMGMITEKYRAQQQGGERPTGGDAPVFDPAPRENRPR